MRCTSFCSETVGGAASCEDVGHPDWFLKEEQVKRAVGRLPIYHTFAFVFQEKGAETQPSASETSSETTMDA